MQNGSNIVYKNISGKEPGQKRRGAEPATEPLRGRFLAPRQALGEQVPVLCSQDTDGKGDLMKM